jgi:phage terminase large subunit-like protein
MPTAALERRLTLGADVADWIEAHCVYPTGEKIGQPFRLLPWQRAWLADLYRCDEDGGLQYRWALLGIPKKNGKSTLIAALALYHLLGDPYESDPWAVCAAASDRQADIVFNAAKQMCELSPELRAATDRYRWEIRPKGAPGKLERVAASAGRLDGKNLSLVVVDELHEWNWDNWTILTNGTVGRRRAQVVQITTAGFDEETICYHEYEKGMAIQKGEIENPSYLFKWYGAPDGADHRDPNIWAEHNPSFGELVTYDQLQDKLINVPESEFRRYFLNQWVAAENLWLPGGAWDACENPGCDLIPGEPTYVGWDASTKEDSTAVVAVQRVDEKWRCKAWIWERPRDRDGNPIDDWTVPGAEIANFLRDMWRHQYPVKGIAYDPAFITWLANDLAAEGLPMAEWPQSDTRMIPATQAAYQAIVNGEVEHDGDPNFARHIRNAVAVQTQRGGERITKGSKAKKKIDAAVALLMALATALKMFGQKEVVWASV